MNKTVGKKSSVVSEPDNIDFYATELSDLDTYIETLEGYIGEYSWVFYLSYT